MDENETRITIKYATSLDYSTQNIVFNNMILASKEISDSPNYKILEIQNLTIVAVKPKEFMDNNSNTDDKKLNYNTTISTASLLGDIVDNHSTCDIIVFPYPVCMDVVEYNDAGNNMVLECFKNSGIDVLKIFSNRIPVFETITIT
tara:strand:+ start:1366 stop:1803 length:438 start_codon:yes stop_codon:yes gene_type:complete